MGRSAARLIALTVVLAWAGLAASQSVQEIARLGLSSTVTLVAYDADGHMFSTGSGFFVAPGLVLTNQHVIDGAHDISAHPLATSERLWLDSVVLQDRWLDLALLSFSEGGVTPLEFQEKGRPEIGETIFAVGSPLGLEGTFTQGIVSSYREGDGISIMQISAPVSPGSSGGPVLDASGKVVGVVVASLIEGQNLNFAVPAAEVRGFLTRAYRRLGTAPVPERAAVPEVPEPAASADPPTPGFDCAYAGTWSEHAICGSHRLADLDVLLNEAFGDARERLSEAAFGELHSDQVAWLATREECELEAPNAQESCLAQLMRDRIAYLMRYE